MDWKYLFTSVEGRIGRKSYWLASLAIAVIVVVAELIDMLVGTANQNGFGIISAIAVLALIYPSIALYAKRWHDRDKSGWWTLISFVPVIGGLWMLIECGFLKGMDGPNRFGPDPLKG